MRSHSTKYAMGPCVQCTPGGPRPRYAPTTLLLLIVPPLHSCCTHACCAPGALGSRRSTAKFLPRRIRPKALSLRLPAVDWRFKPILTPHHNELIVWGPPGCAKQHTERSLEGKGGEGLGGASLPKSAAGRGEGQHASQGNADTGPALTRHRTAASRPCSAD